MRKLFAALIAGSAMVGMTSAALAAPNAKITVKNSVGAKINYEAGGGFQGVPNPSLPTSIEPFSTSTQSTVASPYSTSSGGSFYYRNNDSFRRCYMVFSRTKSSVSGPWNYPTANATPDSGSNCRATISNVQSTGEYDVQFEVY